MMKTPGIDLGVPARMGAVGMLYRIVSGETAALLKGEIFQLKLPDIIQDRVILNLKGQEITIEGLPKTLEGKVVTFKVTGNGTLPLLELLNPSTKKEPLPQTLSAEIKSAPATAEKTEAKPTTVQPLLFNTSNTALRKATLVSPAQTLPQNRTSFKAMVAHTSGKKAVLTALPVTTGITKEPPKATTVKTAHAVANTKFPERLVARENTASPIEIRLNHLAAPLKKGQQLLVEIKHAKTGKHVELLLKPAERTASPPETTPLTRRPSSAPFPSNTLITAKVEQRLSNGKITFQWQGHQLEAAAPSNVKAGDTLLLKTSANQKSTAPALALEVVDLIRNVPEKATSLFKQRIGMSEPLSQVLRNLTQPPPAAAGDKPLLPAITTQLGALTTLMENYTVTDAKPLNGDRLALMIRHSGQLYESLMGKEIANGEKPAEATVKNDLKAILLKLFEVAQTAEKSSPNMRIADVSEQGTARIESQQSINLLAFQQAEPIRMEFPLIIQGMLSAVQMAISMEPGKEHENSDHEDEAPSKAFNILFALELSQLGNIRVDARITSHSVHATIYSEKREARHLFQQHITRITERLEALGFKDIQISAATNEEQSLAKQESFSRLELGLPITKGLLDVTG